MDFFGHLTIFQKMDSISKMDFLLLDNYEHRKILSFTNKIVNK